MTASTPTADGGALVGIDAGGTTVQVAIRDASGGVHERTITDAAWNTASFAERARLVGEIVHDAGAPVRAVGVGAHGCDSAAQCATLHAGIAARVAAPVSVVNDAVLFGYAMGAPTAVNVVLGTGSIAVVRDARGEAGYFGGWGWILGDDGSAWGLVRTAVRRLTLTTADDVLEPLLLERTGSASLRDLVDTMQRSYAGEWAGWADAVFAAAAQGSPAAASAIDRGVAHTVELVRQAAVFSPTSTTAVIGGGVAAHQPAYAERVARTIAEELGLTAVPLDASPALGALRLAEESLSGLRGVS